MSLSLGPSFLASIALAINSVEGTPRPWRVQLDKREDFSNAPASSTKKSSTSKKSSTTKKTTTTKKSSTTSKAATTPQSSASVTPVSSSAAILPSIASNAVPTGSAIIDSTSNTLTTQSSTANNLVSTSAAASNDSNSKGGISGGAIGGIVAAIVIVIVGAAAYFVIARKRKNKNNTRSMSGKPDPFNMGFGNAQGFQSQTQYNQPMMTDNYQTYNNNQPGLAVSSNPPYYQNNPAGTQYHDPNGQFVPEVMPPPALAPQQPMQHQYQPQYQPQLQPHIQPYGETEHIQVDPNAVAVTTAAAATTTAAAVTAPAPPAPAPATKLQPTQSGSLGVYFVVATYSPTLSDEVDIQAGDQVEVLVEYDDGWCQGINLTRGNAKGVFPKHCIESDNSAQSNNGDGDSNKRVSSMYMA